jgi:hypothetical protein
MEKIVSEQEKTQLAETEKLTRLNRKIRSVEMKNPLDKNEISAR